MIVSVTFRRRKWTGTSYQDQIARLKFRLLHLLPEICEKSHTFLLSFHGHVVVQEKFCSVFPRNTLVSFHDGATFVFGWIASSHQSMGDCGSFAMSMIQVFVSVAKNFVHSSTAADQGYHAFGDLARFVYCLLQKIKKASSLPLVEQWEEYVVPNHSRLPAIDERDFLSGTRVTVALDKVGSQYLQTEFLRDDCRFLEEFVNCVLLLRDQY